MQQPFPLLFFLNKPETCRADLKWIINEKVVAYFVIHLRDSSRLIMNSSVVWGHEDWVPMKDGTVYLNFESRFLSRHYIIATFSGPERNLNHKRDIKWDIFSDIYPVLPWSFWRVHYSDISKHNLVSRKRLEKKGEIRTIELCMLGNFVSREVNIVLSLLSLHLHSFPL